MITLTLALLLQGEEIVGPPKPTYYRWKDRKGQIQLTTTMPPPNATIVEVLHKKNTVVPEPEAPAPPPTPAERRRQMESVLDIKTISYWHNVENSLYSARQSGNVTDSINTVDRVLRDTIWGNGLWALTLLPVVITAIFLLSAWWVCIRLSRRAKALLWTSAALSGLVLSHLGLCMAVYRPQMQRLDFMLSMMPNYLGDYADIKPESCTFCGLLTGPDHGDYAEMKTENREAIQTHADTLKKATTLTSPTWAFPLEVDRLRHTLQRVVVEI